MKDSAVISNCIPNTLRSVILLLSEHLHCVKHSHGQTTGLSKAFQGDAFKGIALKAITGFNPSNAWSHMALTKQHPAKAFSACILHPSLHLG